MRLEPPLSNLLDRCMTICVAECCGIGAYDLHPIHVASYLLMHEGVPDEREVAQIRAQLDSLKANYGSAGASGRGAEFEDLNQAFTGSELDDFVDHLRSALDVAIAVIRETHAAGAATDVATSSRR